MNIMENSVTQLGSSKATRPQTPVSQNVVQLSQSVTLMRRRMHEVTGLAADSFAASVMACTSGPSVWIGRARDVRSVCPLAALKFFDPNRIITTECISRQEILWASEQALRSKGADTVIIHLSQGPNLRESRRLQLAAEEGRSLGLVIIEKCAHSSAAQTRWQCDPAKLPHGAANDQGWVWRLTKNKSGKLGTWHVRWQRNTKGKDGYAAGYVNMVSAAFA